MKIFLYQRKENVQYLECFGGRSILSFGVSEFRGHQSPITMLSLAVKATRKRLNEQELRSPRAKHRSSKGSITADYLCCHLAGGTLPHTVTTTKTEKAAEASNGSGTVAAPSRPRGKITVMKRNQPFTATICEIWTRSVC